MTLLEPLVLWNVGAVKTILARATRVVWVFFMDWEDVKRNKSKTKPCKVCGCCFRYIKEPKECPECASRRAREWKMANIETARFNDFDRHRRIVFESL